MCATEFYYLLSVQLLRQGKPRFCRWNTSELVTQPVFDAFLNLLNGTTINDALAVYFGVELNTSTLATQVLQSTMYLGKPDENACDAKKEEERFNKWANGRYEAVDNQVTKRFHPYIVSGHRSSAIFGTLHDFRSARQY